MHTVVMSTASCRLCLRPCRFTITDHETGEELPGYCAYHGASMLRPYESSTVQGTYTLPALPTNAEDEAIVDAGVTRSMPPRGASRPIPRSTSAQPDENGFFYCAAHCHEQRTPCEQCPTSATDNGPRPAYWDCPVCGWGVAANAAHACGGPRTSDAQACPHQKHARRAASCGDIGSWCQECGAWFDGEDWHVALASPCPDYAPVIETLRRLGKCGYCTGTGKHAHQVDTRTGFHNPNVPVTREDCRQCRGTGVLADALDAIAVLDGTTQKRGDGHG